MGWSATPQPYTVVLPIEPLLLFFLPISYVFVQCGRVLRGVAGKSFHSIVLLANWSWLFGPFMVFMHIHFIIAHALCLTLEKSIIPTNVPTQMQ